jgi:superfamily I DNA/RNA helicase
MKFFLYDKFMDSFIRLPKGMQKKTMDFIEKFRRDPKSGAIHLEKINTFKDQQLRTARVDLDWRAIIHVSEQDEVYHLLWVDHHDEAMAWASRKTFEWNRFTQTYQVYEAQEVPAEMPAAMPESTTFMSKFNLDELLKIGVPEVLLPSIQRMNDLNDLQAMESYLPQDVFERLFNLFDGNTIDQILTDVSEGVSIDEGGIAENSPNNRRFFFEITDVDLAALFNDDFKKWKIFLHPTQQKLANGAFKGAVKVSGLAGTGKTICALHRAKFLSTQPDVSVSKPILFTTFTKSLVVNLKSLLDNLQVDTTKVVLQNVHAYVIDQSKKLQLIDPHVKIIDFYDDNVRQNLWEEVLDKRLSTFEPDFLQTELEEVVYFLNIKDLDTYLTAPRVGRTGKIGRKDRVEIWGLLQTYLENMHRQGYISLTEAIILLTEHYQRQTDKPFSHLIADEIQDFSTVELRLLRSLVAEGPNDLFLVGDPLQKIYSRKINFTKAGINVRGMRSRQLKVNYRTTEEIRRAAVQAVQQISFDNFDDEEERKNGYISLTHGAKPVYEVFPTAADEISYLVETLKEWTESPGLANFQYGDICVACRLKNAIQDIKKTLHHHRIPYFDLTTNTGDKNGVHLTTFHNCKGLEFRAMILAGINQHNFPFRPKDYEKWDVVQQREHDRQERSLLYVAMTRAIQHLLLTGTIPANEGLAFLNEGVVQI